MSKQKSNEWKKILSFWFGNNIFESKERSRKWFVKDNTFDELIKNNFFEILEIAMDGKLIDWSKFPESSLALIILLDQFSRNIFRNSKKAFSQDKLSLKYALDALDNEFDKFISWEKKFFFYLPLEHSEDKELVEKSVSYITQWKNEAPTIYSKDAEKFLYFTQKHLEVIKKFGRYPHRNKILKRISTKEELIFLQTPGSSF